MTTLSRRLFTLIALAATALPALAQAPSAAWPSRPVRYIVPFPPGGSADAISRLLAAEMSRTFGQQVVVENRPGAGATIGVDQGVKAAPDGHTIFLAPAGAMAINLSLMPKLPYDPLKDVQPISLLALIPMVAAVPADSAARSVADFIAQARARPGALSFGSAGNGTAMHLSGEMFQQMTGTRLGHVPYKGSGPAVTDLLTGAIPIAFVDLSSALPHIRAGKVRGLATLGAQRTLSAPELPTMAEQGVAGYDAVGWFGLAGPVGMPAEVVERFAAEVGRVMRLPDVRDKSLALGAEPAPGTPAQFAAFIRAEIPKWAAVVKSGNVKVD
ncbi:MAG: Bug family tripartite tricarboxylate transporter substrate binding protein [Burkholderiaceae bacterium]|jgi:tripartite-type tricarboxylate transporter receptor subunit TctC